MSEKVLGFKTSEGYDTCGHGCHWKIISFTPVVSLEWLEKEFAKHDGIIINGFKKEILKNIVKHIWMKLRKIERKIGGDKIGYS